MNIISPVEHNDSQDHILGNTEVAVALAESGQLSALETVHPTK